MLAKSNMFVRRKSMIELTLLSSLKENGSLGVSESLQIQSQTFQNFMCISAMLLEKFSRKRMTMRPIYFSQKKIYGTIHQFRPMYLIYQE